MLDFFRRYQKYFFVVITFVIIVSFSFFGTYSTLGNNQWREQLAFKAIDGREVTRADVDEMALFLATDSNDKKIYGGAWGPNFLNDGVIQKDFLETGLAAQLVQAYAEDMQPGLDQRFEKEKRTTLYSHPQARFLNVQNIWNYFVPSMAEHYTRLQRAQGAINPEAFESRIHLFLAQKQFNPAMLRQMLRYQEKQYQWLTPDANLDRMDLSLFGYHTIEDWFSPAFTRLVSEFIMNAALLAEAQGYNVTKAEALADLIKQTQASYQENRGNASIGVASPEEYFNEQLRIMNMDQTRAVKIWRQVLLFRRYFQDVGHSALVDTLPFSQFNDYSQESLTADLYRLPNALHIADYKGLQNFQIYLDAIGGSKDSLQLPERFLTAEEVARTYPELVQKRYLIEYAEANQKKLQARIALKELWNWEVQDANWETLKVKFPELGISGAVTRDERFQALEALNPKIRSQVDAFAKNSLVHENPEWVAQALAAAPVQKTTLSLRQEGGSTPFNGVEGKEPRMQLMQLLDEARLGGESASLQAYSANDKDYYRIKVLERDSKPAVLTYQEALQDGTLDQTRLRILEKAYLTVRSQTPDEFQNDKKDWKPFSQVEEKVADLYFKKALDDLKKGDANQVNESRDRLASLRFSSYMDKARAEIAAQPQKEGIYIAKANEEKEGGLGEQAPLSEQWRLSKKTVSVTRQGEEAGIHTATAFTLPIGQWSDLQTPVNGDLSFYKVQERGQDVAQQEKAIAEQTKRAQELLSREAQRILMTGVLAKIEEKNAISLKYLLKSEEFQDES